MKQTDYRKKNNRSKLNMTMIALVVSFVVLVMAAFAWYTLSTNPEIKGMSFRVNAEQAILVSQDGQKFSNSENLSDKFKDVGALVPTSTVDGLNWFVCKYDMSGNVLQSQDTTFGTQFQYLRFPNGGNEGVAKTDSNGNQEATTQNDTTNSKDKEKQCYYIYTDIWLKTEQDQANVYLSIPNNASGYDTKQDATENHHYGSYVMSYHVNKTADGKKQIQLTEGGSETSARVGFLVMQGTGDKNTYEHPEYENVTSHNFYIYEPNADRRSEVDKSSDNYDADQYVAGFKAKDNIGSLTYGNAKGYYLPTYPIGVRGDTSEKLQIELNNIKNNTTKKYDDVVKSWNSDGQGKTDTYKGYDGQISEFPADHLLVQKASTWKKDAGTATQELTAEKFDSTMIGSMGTFFPLAKLQEIYPESKTFYKDNRDYTATDASENKIPGDLRSSVPLVTLTKDKPVKVRLYFWLEGQDVDCWNDIADTDFLVNLEFVGDVDTTSTK